MRVPPARWETIQQFIRIAIFSAAGWLFGSDWTDEPMVAEAVGGAVALANLIWWMVWETKRPASATDAEPVPKPEPVPEPEEGTTTVTTTTTKDPAPTEAPTPKEKPQ